MMSGTIHPNRWEESYSLLTQLEGNPKKGIQAKAKGKATVVPPTESASDCFKEDVSQSLRVNRHAIGQARCPYRYPSKSLPNSETFAGIHNCKAARTILTVPRRVEEEVTFTLSASEEAEVYEHTVLYRKLCQMNPTSANKT